jgi:hypothetical protein
VDPYAVDDPKTIGEATAFRSPYGHLFNFFQSSNSKGPGANFSRLLDYVGVPSKFLGTETWYNPEIFSQRRAFRPPLNRLSRFRDPGRVNINTIHDERVWDAVCAHQISWSKLQASRGPVDDPNLPTYYPRPFRSAASADLMPLPQLEQITSEATLLRSDPEDSTTPLFVQRSSDAFRDADKNPYFRYQTLQRLGGMVTNHSNVFAVWVSVGYFELDQNPRGIDEAHPDGYRLATELGSETGGVTRHRAFYIIDRSLPVAFEPGQNHNAGNAVVLRRFID